ncbi:MAG TPA: MgtC/SapB family protein, partial [Planctomycetota bacterium]|nr:MgtC/SapB family protein [Planctomycetota bacterium]
GPRMSDLAGPVTATAAAAASTAARTGAAWIDAAYPFAISLAIGLLVGIERERKRLRSPEDRASLPGGIRTFPLIALLGCAVGWLAERHGAPVLVAGIGGFSAVVVAVYVMTSLAGDLGMTTEVAALLTFVFGVMVEEGEPLLASALAVATTVLLSARERLHDAVLRIEPEDLFAALTLAVVTVIVLPMLPDRGLGPYAVWNPFKIWLFVILLSAIGFAGYIAVKVLGAGRGVLLSGLLGGIVSSTAATLSFAGRSREAPALSRPLAAGITLAWAVMFVRLGVLVEVANPALLPRIAAPMAAAAAAGLGGAAIVYLRARRASGAEPAETAYRNPFSLVSAAKFGLVFAAILLLAKLAQARWQDAGVLGAAALSGLLDVDAISLTAARLASRGELAEGTASLAILAAAGANVLMKLGLAVFLGTPELRRALAPVGLASLAAGAAVALAR